MLRELSWSLTVIEVAKGAEMSDRYPALLTIGTIGTVAALLIWGPGNGQLATAVAAEVCPPDLAAVKERHDSTIELLSTRQKNAIGAFDVSYMSVAALDDRDACRSISNALLDVLDAHRKRFVDAGRLPPLRLELSREAFADAMPISKFSEPVSLTRFLNMPVTTPLGQDVGRVVDVRLDPSTGRWMSFVVAKTGWFGSRSEQKVITISRLRFDKDEKRLLIFDRKRVRRKEKPSNSAPKAVLPKAVVTPMKPLKDAIAKGAAQMTEPPALRDDEQNAIDRMPTRVLKVK